jgi:hypothetical protein
MCMKAVPARDSRAACDRRHVTCGMSPAACQTPYSVTQACATLLVTIHEAPHAGAAGPCGMARATACGTGHLAGKSADFVLLRRKPQG